ncbi:hypothetical protein B0H13DRAFT_2254728 [Mycena leptocephala]|nr:hypothetical protein B0H13DRAFT_2254728 [Mycena leptocephala]
MSRNYPIRPSFPELGSDDFNDEGDAVSTIGATSSPPGPRVPDIYMREDVPFMDLGSDDLRDEESDLTYGSNSRAPKSTDTDKTLAVLDFMKENYPRFSLRDLFTELFTSDDSSIKNVTNTFFGMSGGVHLLKIAIGNKGRTDKGIADWIMAEATAICTREVSQLTDRASRGDHFEDAKSLRIPANSVNIELLKSFSIPGLLQLYERTTSHLQKFLQAVIGKDSPPPSANESVVRSQRNPDMGRTLITSIILNLRSRETNLHGAMNVLMLWDARVPKRVVQTLNRYGFCTSYLYQSKAVISVSKDGVRIARHMQTAWEASATHGSISHDQVSALLVVLALPKGSPLGEAARLAGVENFAQTAKTRHLIPPDQALEEILPTALDQRTFADNAMKHVADLLCDELEGFGSHRNDLPDFFDPYALDDTQTEEYFLPTYEQEQSSTLIFEDRNFFLLGDRLTTARDRAAQDQRAVDRSEHRIDHLSSFEAISGIMHFVLNKIQNLGKNTWGGANKDAVSLLTLLEKLPNRTNINLRKIDFYAWLRFLDTVLRALVLRAAMVILDVASPSELSRQKLSSNEFKALCLRIVAEFLLPSIDRLEADEVKNLPGSTQSGNAVLLMHDLMTIREMCHAIKHGHPERMERMLKYWTPMFYAGGGFNYANESMELLHNLNHDWPADISPILRGGMLMNTQGKPAKFKETDIRVEQFNKDIKSHAHGAMRGRELTEQIFEDLGVNDEDQHHAHVRQRKDVALLLDHLCTSKIFDFSQDKSSNHTVIDLYRIGLHRLAGPDGGHAKHLRRHDAVEELEKLDRELTLDNERPKLTLLEQLERLDDMIRWDVDYSADTVDLYD